jgi:RecB family exonuclease
VLATGPRTVIERVVESAVALKPVTTSNGHKADVHLSYSGITSYLDCPRQYWYRYVERLPVVQSAEAVHGVILHEVLRKAGEARREGKRISAALVRSLHADAWRTTPFPDERRAATFKRNGLAELEAYRKGGGFNDLPAYLEHPFKVAIDGWTLRGVIDRIDRIESGWRIIDFKSGRPVTRRRRDLQLALYALGATSALQLDPLEAEVVYLASGQSVRVEKVGGLVNDARQESVAVAEGIAQGRFETRPERRRCRLCPYRLACADAL